MVAMIPAAGSARPRRPASLKRSTRSRPRPSNASAATAESNPSRRPAALAAVGDRRGGRLAAAARTPGRRAPAARPGTSGQTGSAAAAAERAAGRDEQIEQHPHRGTLRARRVTRGRAAVPDPSGKRERAVDDRARPARRRASSAGIGGDQRADLDRHGRRAVGRRATIAPAASSRSAAASLSRCRTVSGEDAPEGVLERLELGRPARSRARASAGPAAACRR